MRYQHSTTKHSTYNTHNIFNIQHNILRCQQTAGLVMQSSYARSIITTLCLQKGHFVFAYILDICQPTLTIFSTHMYYRKFATGECITNPPCTVCRTALPCKILITTLVMFTAFCPRTRTRTCKLVLEDSRGRGLSSRTTTLGHRSLLPI